MWSSGGTYPNLQPANFSKFINTYREWLGGFRGFFIAGRFGSAFQQAAQHPGILFVNLHALGQQVGRRFIAGLVDQREEAARRLGHGLLASHQLLDHLFGADLAFTFLDHRQLGEFPVGSRRGHTQRADAFGDQVEGIPQLGVLVHEHHVQCVEHGAGHIPVEIVCLQVQRERVGEQARQPFGNFLAILLGDSDIHGNLLML